MARREVTGRKSSASATVNRDNAAPDPEDDEPPPPRRLALSIQEFCEAHRISEDFYYKLKRQRQGPREMQVGSRVLISFESAAEWRREREAASTVKADHQMSA
jgi:hypothetical protein